MATHFLRDIDRPVFADVAKAADEATAPLLQSGPVRVKVSVS